MKSEIPPWVAAALVVAAVLVIGAFLFFGSGPGRQAKEMESAINASAAKPGQTIGAPSGPGAPEGPAQTR